MLADKTTDVATLLYHSQINIFSVAVARWYICLLRTPGAQVGFNTRASIPTMQIIRYSCAGVDCWVSFTSSYLPFQWEFTQPMSALSIELTW